MTPAWVTNNPKAARSLRAADATYKRSIAKAALLPLAQKIAAVKAAKAIRAARYAAG